MPSSDAGDSAASSPVETHNNLFSEPEGYFPPTPPPTTQTYTLLSSPSSLPANANGNANNNNNKTSPLTITLHLVGYSPTEAHHLWNGARVLAEYLEAHPREVRGKTVLELGAGAGLPSLVGAVLGARCVLMTDYPDVDIVQTMWRNIDQCALIPRRTASCSSSAAAAASAIPNGGDDDDKKKPAPRYQIRGNDDDQDEDQDVIRAKGFVWGADPTPLLSALPAPTEAPSSTTPAKFDVLILADLLFRHSEHGHLLDTIRDTMAPGGKSFVFFTSYRPWLQHKDLAFFDLARERGFVVEKLLERKMDKPMFENDPGDEEVRKTCTGWIVRWSNDE